MIRIYYALISNDIKDAALTWCYLLHSKRYKINGVSEKLNVDLKASKVLNSH